MAATDCVRRNIESLEECIRIKLRPYNRLDVRVFNKVIRLALKFSISYFEESTGGLSSAIGEEAMRVQTDKNCTRAVEDLVPLAERLNIGMDSDTESLYDSATPLRSSPAPRSSVRSQLHNGVTALSNYSGSHSMQNQGRGVGRAHLNSQFHSMERRGTPDSSVGVHRM